MDKVWRPARAGRRLRVGVKLSMAVGVLVLALVVVAVVGGLGVTRTGQQADRLFTDNVQSLQQIAQLEEAVQRIEGVALQQIPADTQPRQARLDAELDDVLLPRATEALVSLRALSTADQRSLSKLARVDAGLRTFQELRRTGAYRTVGPKANALPVNAALAERTAQLFLPVVAAIENLRNLEQQQAIMSRQQAVEGYQSTRLLLAAIAGLSLLVGLALVLLLSRNLVPRIRHYSQFATDLAAGRRTEPLRLPGTDELAELGAALNEMVLHRDQVTRAEQEQRETVGLAEQAQAEFVDTLQVTRSEDEAQELLQRHLQRSLPGSTAAVLRSNNSANRLQAATELAKGDELADRLVGAEPRSCVAVRLSRTHREGTSRPPLLSCELCQHAGRPSSCEPLLVGGEVIGSVLLTHPAGISDANEQQIKSTVTQAAPVLANLRSLALAEFRANNDSLTGLPNKRATEDTLKRMVAQASRSVIPLTAVMLDLDHFKQVNDRYGHAQGDEVLAAVGAAITASLRASDFAGRFGGEEFLILLPDTDLDAAWQVAERIRAAIASITIPGVERDITASLGLAGLLEHAGNAGGLLKEADRAQYAAKAAGRNRTVIASVARVDPQPALSS